MFEEKDFKEIDTTYFEVKTKNLYHIVLKSKNTGHLWDIESRSLSIGKRSLVVMHKHKEDDSYHEQIGHPRSVKEAAEMIKSHDLFQLNGRKK